MNPDELLQMLREANAAIRDGADPNVVSGMIAEFTGGEITSLQGLGRAVQAAKREAPESPTLAAQSRLAQRGGSAVGDFGRMAAQGASFGFADELAGLGAAVIPGGKGYTEARDASRQRVDDLRTLAPGASMMSEIAGGVAVPFGAGTGISRALTKPGAGVVARGAAGAAGGAVAGGAGGALYGAGEADEGSRLGGALKGGAVGAVTGGVVGGALPVIGAALSRTSRFGREVLTPEAAGQNEARRRLRQVFEEAGLDADDVMQRMDKLGPDAVIADLDPRLAREARTAVNQAPALDRAGGPAERLAQRTEARGERMAKALRKTSGISETMPQGQTAARRAVQEVREEFYHPLEEAFPQVQGENVRAALNNPRIAQIARRTSPDIVADENAIRRAIRQGVPEEQARSAISGKRPPSFTELQDIKMDLDDAVTSARAAGRPNASRRAAEARDAMLGAMEQDIPGFREAQNAYRLASKKLEGYELGFNAWSGSAREITEAMQELPPEAQDSFRVGLIQRWEEKLLTKEGTAGSVNAILKAGEDMRGQIRAAFGSEDEFQRFLRQRDLERTFRRTEVAVHGNSTTAEQAADLLDAAPVSKNELLNSVWRALFSPGESRRIQAQAVGERLMGRNVRDVQQTLRPNPFGFGRPGAGGGLGAFTGTTAAQQLPGRAPPAAPPSTVASDSIAARIINPSGRNPLAELVSRLGRR